VTPPTNRAPPRLLKNCLVSLFDDQLPHLHQAYLTQAQQNIHFARRATTFKTRPMPRSVPGLDKQAPFVPFPTPGFFQTPEFVDQRHNHKRDRHRASRSQHHVHFLEGAGRVTLWHSRLWPRSPMHVLVRYPPRRRREHHIQHCGTDGIYTKSGCVVNATKAATI